MRVRVFFIFLSLIIVLQSCAQSKNKIEVLKKGYTWKYEAISYDNNNIPQDTILIEMRIKRNIIALIANYQIPIQFNYTINNINFKESTGGIDNNNEVSIHSPRESIFAFTSILPMPTIYKPFENVFTSEVKTKFVKSTFNQLNGQVVSQKLEHLGTIDLTYKNSPISCFKIKAQNTSQINSLGQYTGYYYFNKELGFVKLTYFKPSGEKLVVQLIDLTKE